MRNGKTEPTTSPITSPTVAVLLTLRLNETDELRESLASYREQLVRTIAAEPEPKLNNIEVDLLCAGFRAGYRTATRQHKGA